MTRMIAVVLGTVVLVIGGAVASAAVIAAAGGGTVYIATGENFPDAVAAGAAGGAAEGPVLLVRQDSIPTVTLDELNRLQPSKIVIVGGTAVISQTVEDGLKALSFRPAVVRKGGADRYETAALLSAGTFPKTGAVSCPGAGFYPTDSSDGYEGVNRRWHTGGGAVLFACTPSLPQGATVTTLSAGIVDVDGAFDGACALWRVTIIGEGTLFALMAATPSTVGTPGEETLTTSDIDHPSVDNARYGYLITCTTSLDLQITGATVEYELTG